MTTPRFSREKEKVLKSGSLKDLFLRYQRQVNQNSTRRKISPFTHSEIFEVACLISDGFVRRGDPKGALSEFEYALKIFTILRDSLMIGKTLIEMVEIETNLGLLREPLRRIEQAYKLINEQGEDRDFAKLYLHWGILNVQRGRLEEAETYLNDALTYFRKLDDLNGMGMTLNHLARVLYMRGFWRQAVNKLQKAIMYAKKVGNIEAVNIYSINVGLVYLFSGDWKKVEERLQNIYRLQEIQNTATWVRVSLVIAFLNIYKRNWEEAEKLLKKAKEISESQRYMRELGMSYEYLGRIRIERGKYQEADEYYKKAYEIAEEIAPESDLMSQVLRGRAEICLATEKVDEAKDLANKALSIAKKTFDRLEIGILYRVLAQTAEKRGEKEEAVKLYKKSITLLEELNERFERAESQLEFGRFLSTFSDRETRKEALNYLFRAEGIFSELGSKYWIGKAKLEIARLKGAEGEIENAFMYLNVAEKLFSEAKESIALEEAHEVRSELEKALKTMVEASIKSYSLLSKQKEASRFSLDKMLSLLVKRIKAERAFVAFRGKGDKFQLEGHENIDERAANAIIKALFEKNGDIKTGQLLVNTKGFHRDSLRNSLIMPFGKDITPKGLLYVDRGEKKGPFNRAEVTLFALYADNFLIKLKGEEEERLRSENIELKRLLRERVDFSGIVTQNPLMMGIIEQAKLLAMADVPVLIEGESGTGKELFALALHYNGPRREGRVCHG